MSKLLWKILLLATGGLALWRVSVVSWDLWHYFRLEFEVPVQNVQWELMPKGSKYALKASYSYPMGEKIFESSCILPKPYHLNRKSAEREMQKISGMQWSAWVDAKAPQRSSLSKKFPFRETFYAAALLGIFLYFCYLRFHLELLSRSL